MYRLTFIIAVIFSLLSAPLLLPSESTARFSGVVCSTEKGRPLANVYVKLPNGEVLAISDQRGSYSFSYDDSAPLTIILSLVGFEPKTLNINVDGTRNEYQIDTAFLQVRPWPVEGITVAADRRDRVSATAPQVQVFERRWLETSSGSLNDPMRFLQLLPSVTTANDYRNDLCVRGGNPAEMAVIVDGFETVNINHFGTPGSTGGPFSMIPSDNVARVRFSPGGFSVRYPNRLSALTEVEMIGKKEMVSRGRVRVDLSGVGASYGLSPPEKPLHFFVHARRSYLELLKSQLNLPAVPRLGDLTVKGGWVIGGKQVFSLFSLMGVDRFELPPGLLGYDDGSLDYAYSSSFTGIKWVSLSLPNSIVETKYCFSYSTYDIKGKFSNGVASYLNESIERTHKLSCDFSTRPSNHLEVNIGASYKNSDGDYHLGMENYFDRYGISHARFYTRDKVGSSELGEYAEATSTHVPRLRVTTGVRHDYHVITDAGLFSPRLNAEYVIYPSLTVNASVGRFGQPAPLFWMVTDRKNRNLDYIRATHKTVGLRYEPRGDLQVTLELYHKEYPNYPVSSLNRIRTMVDFGTDYEYYDARTVTNRGHGMARGVDMTLRRDFREDLNIFLGLSLHTSRYAGISGKEIDGDFDTRYHLALAVVYRPFRHLGVSARFVGAGGRPRTPIHTTVSQWRHYTVLDYSQINMAHYPAYHRLDFRVDFDRLISGGKLSAYLDLLNAYDRKNIYLYYWDDDNERIEQIYQWRLLPVAGIAYEF